MSAHTPLAGGSPLPVPGTVAEAYRLLWAYRWESVRLGLVPVSVSFLLATIVGVLPEGGPAVAAALADLIPLTLFAVNWHRLVLLGPSQAAAGLGVRWGVRETTFLVRSLALGFGIGAIMAVPLLAISAALQHTPVGLPVLGLVIVAAVFLSLRLSLVFPAIAVDLAYGFAQSWKDTAGRGLRLLAAMLAASAPLWAALLLFVGLAEASGLADAAPFAVLFLDR
ncbi:MAG: hypothetical protein WEC41_04590, partial [Dongiaceae bacterium]